MISVAPGQTFPIPAGGVSDSMLANPSLTVNPGAGLTGGGTVPLGGTTTLNLATNTCSAGSAVTAHPFTCSPFAGLGANTFTGNQTMPNLTVTNDLFATFGSINGNIYGNAVFTVTNNNTSSTGATGINSYGAYDGITGSSGAAGVGVAGYGGTAGYGVGGFGGTGVWAQGTSTGLWAQNISTTGLGLRADTSSACTLDAAAVLNNFGSVNTGNILLGKYNGTTELTVDAKGDVTASGNVRASGNISASGSLAIGGGRRIRVHHLERHAATAALTGYTPGTSDTIALGIPSSLMNLPPNVFFTWQAWETSTSASPTIAVRLCNPSQVRYAGGLSGTIRMDIFKH